MPAATLCFVPWVTVRPPLLLFNINKTLFILFLRNGLQCLPVLSCSCFAKAIMLLYSTGRTLIIVSAICSSQLPLMLF